MAPKKNKFPENINHFYLKMYMKRKKSKETKYQNQFVEALKSWLSLTETEKQQFYKKYEEYKVKYNEHLAFRLKEAEPYMKRKEGHMHTDNNSIMNVEQLTELEVPVETLPSQLKQCDPTDPPMVQSDHASQSMVCNDYETPDDNQRVLNVDVMQVEQANEVNDVLNGTAPCENLCEPAPPAVKTGRDLYCMLNSMDEEKYVKWASLPQPEKRRYGRAVYLLKKDYIMKYKKYLESLSPRDLFDYYNKTIF